MRFTEKEMLDFIRKTAFLQERMEGDFFSFTDESKIDSYIKRWKEVSAENDCSSFQRRLSWQNIDVDKVISRTGKVRFKGTRRIPLWCGILKKIVTGKSLSLKKIRSHKNFLSFSLPFEELFFPLVMVAMEELFERTGDIHNIVSEKALIMVQCNLLYSLNLLCVHAIYEDFSAFLVKQKSPFEIFIEDITESKEHKIYDDFIRKMLKNSYKDFFREYPVLGRLVSQFIKLWAESTSEFFLRLKEDLPEISGLFSEGKEPGHITELKSGLSDRHNGGRTVIALTFSSGLKLIYKPRNMSLDSSYMKLLSWFNEKSGLPDFKLFNILGRKDYGWAEFVEHIPCKTEEEGRNYYRRTGHLLCLLYVLGSTDCHMENLIACGEYPVFVDLETLMEPEVKFFCEEKFLKRVRFQADKEFFSSVIKTGILPRWTFDQAKKPYDVSVLGSAGHHRRPFLKETWKNLKRDSIKPFIEDGEFRYCQNLPFLDWKILKPFEYKEFILEGFREFYLFLVKEREYLFSCDSPLKNLKDKQIRFFFRFTGTYGMMLKQAVEPSLLRDPLLWSIEMEGLCRVINKDENRKHLWPLVKSEILSLEQLDIPSITCISDSRDLCPGHGEKIENFFSESAYNNVINRIKKLDLEDMERQALLIHSSLYAGNIIPSEDFKDFNIICNENSLHGNLLIGKKLHIADMGEMGCERSLEDDFLIGKKLREYAISFGERGVTWICYKYIQDINRFQLEPADYSLSICGIALFLSALEHIEKKGFYTETILSALKPLLTDLDDRDFSEILLKESGVEGINAIVYSLRTIGHFLDMPVIMDYAKKASLLITSEGI